MGGDRGGADLHNANGVLPDGTPWVSAGPVRRRESARSARTRHGDADSHMLSYQANGIGTAVEAIESGAPVVVLRHEIVPDAAGPGAHRGGTSLMRDSLWLQPAEHHLMSIRYKRASRVRRQRRRRREDRRDLDLGPGGRGRAAASRRRTPTRTATRRRSPASSTPRRTSRPATASTSTPTALPSWHTQPLSVLRYVNNGGGGWGDPLARDPELVKRDVRDGYVTIEGAARDYGVVVRGDPEEDPEGLVVDEPGTATTERWTVTNEELVRTFFATLSAGDLEGVRGFFDEDSTWFIVATGIPGAGEHSGADAIVDGFLAPVRGLFEPGQPKVEIVRLVGDGDLVAVEATGRGRFLDGREYDNRYAYWIEIAGDRIRTIKEYMDSSYVAGLA